MLKYLQQTYNMFQGVNIGKGRIQNRYYLRYSYYYRVLLRYRSCSTEVLNCTMLQQYFQFIYENVLFLYFFKVIIACLTIIL
jgi:hypothetical protein